VPDRTDFGPDRGPGMIDFLKKLYRSCDGATAVEYALIISLIIVAAMVGMMNLADTTIGMWDNIADNVIKFM
jgi:pilus assembly protein Flp/PilA